MAQSRSTGLWKLATLPARRELAASIVALSVLVLLVTAFVPEAVGAEGDIEGLVLNRTGGEAPLRDQEVELRGLMPDGWEDSRLVTRTDDSGRFRFAGLAASASTTYTLTTRYQGVEYQTTVRTPQAPASPEKPELVVFDSSDDVNLQIDVSHLVIEVDPATRDLSVLEIAIVSNPTDRTLIPSAKGASPSGRTLWFPLPRGALRSEVIEGLDETSSGDEDGLGYSGPILPGKRQVVYSYTLANPGSSFSISKPLAYPSRKVSVLMADVGQKVTGARLVSQESIKIKDRNYLFLTGDSFEGGEKLELSVTNFPPPSNSSQGANSLSEVRWIALAVVVIAGLVAALAYPWLRGTGRPAGQVGHAP